jgi:hypothetical protein
MSIHGLSYPAEVISIDAATVLKLLDVKVPQVELPARTPCYHRIQQSPGVALATCTADDGHDAHIAAARKS